MVALATFLAAFPVVLSALNLAVPRNAISFGFSGINMAFAGLLPAPTRGLRPRTFFPRRRYARSPRSSSRSSAGWRFWRCRSRPGVSTNPDSLDSRPRLRGSCSVCCTRRAPGSGSDDGRSETGFGRRSRTPATATCVRHRRRSGRRLPGCRVPRRSDGTRQRSKSVRSPAWVLSRVHRALHPARGRTFECDCPSVPLAAPRPTASHRSPPRCPEPRVYNASMTFSD